MCECIIIIISKVAIQAYYVANDKVGPAWDSWRYCPVLPPTCTLVAKNLPYIHANCVEIALTRKWLKVFNVSAWRIGVSKIFTHFCLSTATHP